MADNVKKLAKSDSFRGLQDRVSFWVQDYNTNSCDENLNYCIGLIEQVAKVQAQLFGILTLTAQEGGHNEGVATIKSRLLPLLETSFSSVNVGKLTDNKVTITQDTYFRDKTRETSFQDQDQEQLDFDSSPDSQQNQVQDDLADTGKSLEGTRNRSTISLMAAEEEINQLKKQLKSLQAQEDARHRNSESRRSEASRSERRASSKRASEARASEPRGSEARASEARASEPRGSEAWASEPRGSEARASDVRGLEARGQEVMFDYEKHLQNLKDEIAVLSAEKSGLQGRSVRSRSPSPICYSPSRGRSRSRSRSNSPCTAMAKVRSPSPNRSKMSSVARKAALLSRFSDAYSQARLDAQCLLRRCIDRAETVQRIIYIATVEAFHVAKMAFRHFKIRVRKMLTPSHVGSNDFECAVLDYIICHLDLYDAQSSVNDVIRAMNVNPKISFPPEVDFCVLSDFIQEICCIAFAMQSLDPPLDIAFGADGEVFNDCKYRRSYDSDFTAPLVFYHVWPALMENDCVIMKGEAVTKRGAFWSSVRPVARCRSRSLSPVCPRSRIGLSTMSRSRSPSPIRCTLPRY
ncbi:mitochondria-eating protein isoform X1 [Microtus ochrogaster]|uniref:Mitochondria-eating protein n=1 Tax=Microtus ochrogaster TaxID=79684 RepID=A0ABM1UFL4_MICOH|nr:mitochondria-eating protein isoform X1 [Microtus ochrogaster]